MYQLCSGEEITIEEQLLKQIDIENKNVRKVAFLIVLKEIVGDYQREKAENLIDLANELINKDDLCLVNVSKAVHIFKEVRESFASEEEVEIYDRLEKDVLELFNVYAKLCLNKVK